MCALFLLNSSSDCSDSDPIEAMSEDLNEALKMFEKFVKAMGNALYKVKHY
jgi:hypothetical protein